MKPILKQWILISRLYSYLKYLSGAVKHGFIRNTDLHLVSGICTISKTLLVFNRHSLFQAHQLQEINTYDLPNNKVRFNLLYYLLSLCYNVRTTIHIQIGELESVPTQTVLYSSAGWMERESWDLFGVFYKGNMDLRRILSDYGFLGYALRKDFPLSGFYELFYNDEYKRIVYQPVEVQQEMRQYNFNTTWVTPIANKNK